MNAVWIGIVVVVVVMLLARTGMGGGANAGAAKEKIKMGAKVVDVRTPEEYRGGHYEGARNIPLPELPNRLAELGDKTKPIVVYCASGMRSANAAKILKAAGFTDVTNAGGLSNLKR
jgi:phage shock protein E